MIRTNDLPVLAVCGWSGSGKTTLIEELIPRLTDQGLDVAVVKHDAHGVDVDRPGKDSDRFFKAGANVVLRAPEEAVTRWHGAAASTLPAVLRQLACRHDVVLVEGHKKIDLPKLWLLREGESSPPEDVREIAEILPWGSDRLEPADQIVSLRLNAGWASRPVLGGVLVGGNSRRMGRTKQLLQVGGVSIIEATVGALENRVDHVVILGDGQVPPSLLNYPRIPDSPGLKGPVAGLLSAFRWCPEAAWLVVSCDLPRFTEGAARWLLEQRLPGRWAVFPKPEDGEVEPLAAVYEPHARSLLERLLDEGHTGPRGLARSPKVVCPLLPGHLAPQWRGVNTPEDWEVFLRSSD